jgi:hypothetical protein
MSTTDSSVPHNLSCLPHTQIDSEVNILRGERDQAKDIIDDLSKKLNAVNAVIDDYQAERQVRLGRGPVCPVCLLYAWGCTWLWMACGRGRILVINEASAPRPSNNLPFERNGYHNLPIHVRSSMLTLEHATAPPPSLSQNPQHTGH